MAQHLDRVEIARHLSARGLGPVTPPAFPSHVNQRTTWAVGYDTAYGRWISLIGAVTAWGIVAGL